jgi:hypothetical protein
MDRTSRRLAVLVAMLALAGCGGSGVLGAKCTQNGDCQSPLSCVEFDLVDSGGCRAITKACSKLCSSDADCASLTMSNGAKSSCSSGSVYVSCGAARACNF